MVTTVHVVIAEYVVLTKVPGIGQSKDKIRFQLRMAFLCTLNTGWRSTPTVRIDISILLVVSLILQGVRGNSNSTN